METASVWLAEPKLAPRRECVSEGWRRGRDSSAFAQGAAARSHHVSQPSRRSSPESPASVGGCGEGGIRTPGTLPGTVVFKTCHGWEEHRLLPIHPNETRLFSTRTGRWFEPVRTKTRTKSGQSYRRSTR